MPELTLDYRHCNRMRPLYVKHHEIEAIAAYARQQLVGSDDDAIALDTLCQIDRLRVNGIDFTLEISTACEVHDEEGNFVFGICEYDPSLPDTAMLCVSPVGEKLSPLLALSTLAHELGHVVFDAPGWIADGSRGPDLFETQEPSGHRAYRTMTPDVEHLAKSPVQSALSYDEYFAELRANEFMGSLLVPRRRLTEVVEEVAPQYDVSLHWEPSLNPEIPSAQPYLTSEGEDGYFAMDSLKRTLASRFGVNPRFIQVRLERYGLCRSQGRY